MIGFWHEHQRSDRDSFVEIRTENAYQSFTFVAEFLRVGQTVNYKIPYDFGSVLHYGSRVSLSKFFKWETERIQESIPVGCVLPACQPYMLRCRNLMSVPVGGGVINEQVWTGLQWWPPDVISRGPGLGVYVWCWETGLGVIYLISRRGPGPVGLYSEVQYIMGNGHMGTACPLSRMTDTTENITFPQLRWQAVAN